jgi:hypothetical protein
VTAKVNTFLGTYNNSTITQGMKIEAQILGKPKLGVWFLQHGECVFPDFPKSK